MIRNIFYFGLGAVAASFVTHAGVPLWTHFSRLINWDIAAEAASDIVETLTEGSDSSEQGQRPNDNGNEFVEQI
ncbi:hypothetical protein C1752_16044 [Acaryochloris thomasi RCC1774]|uniref:Uncharacterized protein n=2 Tax=Acaryochloris TaxID=155977 RepID=A0A2W1JLQ8_9CYAN|nr:hypothetical protein C1752_16044 [Acaryochloris thomasi RCC1774]